MPTMLFAQTIPPTRLVGSTCKFNRFGDWRPGAIWQVCMAHGEAMISYYGFLLHHWESQMQVRTLLLEQLVQYGMVPFLYQKNMTIDPKKKCKTAAVFGVNWRDLQKITHLKFNSKRPFSKLPGYPKRKPDHLPVPPFFGGKLAVKLRGCQLDARQTTWTFLSDSVAVSLCGNLSSYVGKLGGIYSSHGNGKMK